MSRDVIIIAGVIFACAYGFGIAIYLIFRQQLRFKERERVAERVRLDDFRAHMDRQLVQINERFSSYDDRWAQLNHLVLAGQNETHNATPVAHSRFLSSHGIDAGDQEIDQGFVFVLTPFHDDFARDYSIIRGVGQELGFRVSRGDERLPRGDIFPHLLRQIVRARFVVANISGRNPNVFYELGIAHALDKPVIIIARSLVTVPFDVRGKQIVLFNDARSLQTQLKDMMMRMAIDGL